MLFYIAIPLIFYVFYNYESIKEKRSKFNSLFDMVESFKHENRFNTVITCWKIIFKSYYLELCQYLNNSVIDLGNNKYEINYVINDKLYKMIVTKLRGPDVIREVLDQDSREITSLVKPYLGPQDDWHNTEFTPEFFGCKEMTIKLWNKDLTFKDNEKIII